MSTDHTPQRHAVAAEVRALMGRHRISQTTLAAHLGMSQPALSRRLSGDHPFDLDELLEVAAYFDVEVTSLFVGVTQGGSQSPWITTPGQTSLDDLLLAAA